MAFDNDDFFSYEQPAQFIGEGEGDGSNGVSVVRRNARERNRVKQVNNGFSQLRQHIPVAVIADLSNGRRGIGPGANKKLSKVSTLRMAVEYIRRLQKVIDETDQKRHQQQNQQHQQHQQQNQQHHHHQQQQQHLLFQQQQQLFYHQQQIQQQQQHMQLSSPTGSASSCCSSTSSSSYYTPQVQQSGLSLPMADTSSSSSSSMSGPMKVESTYEDYRNNSCSSGAEDDDILDYISLWQDDL